MYYKKDNQEIIRVRIPRVNEVIGIVESMLGANRIIVRCQDGNVRTVRIPGKYRKRLWIKKYDVVLVKPWEIQGETKGDVVWRYKAAEVGWLRRKGILKME